MTLELSPELAAHFGDADPFDAILALEGEIFREHKNRRTFRVELSGRPYFVKIHGHTSWRELLKNGSRGRAPVLTAQPEWDAVKQLERLGVPTVSVAGLGIRGRSPAGLESFIITEALEGFVHLDDVARLWRDLPDPTAFRLRRAAALEIASAARTLHTNGLNHRDFYLCHFMLRDRDWSVSSALPLDLHVIDLHRMQHRASTPRRWAVKDMAGILFSALDEPMSTGDAIRFMERYFDRPRRAWGGAERSCVRAMIRRVKQVYRRDHGRDAVVPRGLERI